MTIATRIFYRKIHFLFPEHLPKKGAGIVIANHPGSLMDAALLGLLLKRQIHFFARGDLFVNPLVNRILKWLHMYPVHHHKDGKNSVAANDTSFEKAIELLKEGELVLFFPEGFSHVDYRLLPFKKGAFRLALRALQELQLSTLPVIPVGFHYSDPTLPGQPVWVRIGQPIETKTYLNQYAVHPAAAIKSLTQDSYSAIQNLVIDLPEAQQPAFLNYIRILRVSNDYKRLNPLQQLELEKTISDNFTQVTHDGLSRPSPEKAQKFEKNWLYLLLPLTLIGYLVFAWPLALGKYIADTRVTRIDFYAWIWVAAAALLTLVWVLIIGIVSFVLLPPLSAIGLLATLAVCAFAWWLTAPLKVFRV